jgi:hypothetical protein
MARGGVDKTECQLSKTRGTVGERGSEERGQWLRWARSAVTGQNSCPNSKYPQSI